MTFDPCPHHVNNILIQVGRALRKFKGEPAENNLTVLVREAAIFIGRNPAEFILSTRQADHLPSPAEMKTPDGEFLIPSINCPKCGKRAFLESICQSCEDAENGKYKSGYNCRKETGGCGLISDKTGEWITQRLNRMGVDWKTGTKEEIGIKTITEQEVR
jgi:hypothetical protein